VCSSAGERSAGLVLQARSPSQHEDRNVTNVSIQLSESFRFFKVGAVFSSCVAHSAPRAALGCMEFKMSAIGTAADVLLRSAVDLEQTFERRPESLEVAHHLALSAGGLVHDGSCRAGVLESASMIERNGCLIIRGDP